MEGEGGPVASALPSPGGLSETPPPPASEDVFAAAARQSLPPSSAAEPTPTPSDEGHGQRRGFSAAGPRNRLRLQRRSGTDTNPCGRHDGLRATPQRGQAPPPAPPPATSVAPLAMNGVPFELFLGRPGFSVLFWSPSLPVRPVSNFKLWFSHC